MLGYTLSPARAGLRRSRQKGRASRRVCHEFTQACQAVACSLTVAFLNFYHLPEIYKNRMSASSILQFAKLGTSELISRIHRQRSVKRCARLLSLPQGLQARAR